MLPPPARGRPSGSESAPAGRGEGGAGAGTTGGDEPATGRWLARGPGHPVPISDGLAARFGIDARALAAFRIAIGLLVLSDLLFRAREVSTFYTDAGVLPRAAHAEAFPVLARLSLHTITGSTAGQASLFAVAGGVALAVTVGYRTRLATAGTVFLHGSLYARNPHVLNGGDVLLVLALFLGVFLPLGARWSVDAVRSARGPGAGRAAHGDRVVGLATATLLLQPVVVYAANGLFKLRSEAWTSGQAVRYALELEQYSILLGPSLTAVPDLLVGLNWAWMVMLWLSPLLVLATGRLRIAVVAAFLGAHLGMLVTMRLGLFPLVVGAMLLPYLPSAVWNRLERSAIAASLDARLAGLAGSVLDTASVSRGTGVPGRSDLPPSVRRLGRTVAVVVLVAALLTSVLWPAAALGAAEGTPAERVVETDDYPWTLFAPNPPTNVVWFVAPVTLESGEEVDGLHGGPVDWSEPADAADRYPSALWLRYLNELQGAGEGEYRPLAAYLCRATADRSGEQPTAVAIYALDRPVETAGGGDVTRHERYRGECPAGR